MSIDMMFYIGVGYPTGSIIHNLLTEPPLVNNDIPGIKKYDPVNM